MYKNFDVEVKPKEDGKQGRTGAQQGIGGEQGTGGKQEPDHCKKIENIESKYKDEPYNLCRKMEKSLEYLKGIEVGGTRRYSCIHYKYWMSHKLLNIFNKFPENEPNKSVLDKFSDIQDIFVKEYNDYGCKYDYKNVKLENLKKMDEKKYLHDYFRSYNTVKEYISCEASKKKMYEEYLKHISKLYDEYKKECSDGFVYWTSNCPLYFKRGDEYDPKKLLEKLERSCSNNRDGQPSEGKEDTGTSQKKRKITFYHLKCKNKVKGDYMRCALIPSTMEYTENEDKSKGNVEKAGKVTFVAPDPSIVLGGVLKKREQKIGQEVESGTSDSTDDFQIVSSASSDDQYNSQYLTEADGISPYLVQTEKGIKWRIHDKETLDCKNYGSEDPYGLCKHLYDLHQKGDFKLNPNPNFRKARSRMSSLEGEDSFPDDGLYEMEDDDTYPSDTGNDMFSLLKTKQFRTGTTIALIILLLDPSLEVKKEREEILTMNILKENRKRCLDVANNR
ncbi:variable surface protein Vir12 [Plasmodium vivax India VII]|uniref:Variable surface protein Vir12 n=1 Tax=Plasmodium vivax India VII TaxID=1077284 RepID=A0A0J9SIM6_PLAVI|nr:variable surface protein Vir12 [Plasmodium vivax India VII]